MCLYICAHVGGMASVRVHVYACACVCVFMGVCV